MDLQPTPLQVSTADARAAEKGFFAQHPVFGTVDPDRFGVENLTEQLTKLLVSRIQQELIPMKNEVEKSLHKVTLESLNYNFNERFDQHFNL